jgi:uncharacterized protein
VQLTRRGDHLALRGIDDQSLIERQIGRRARGFVRVAVRCPHGAPAVIEQSSYLDDGTPFPTTYYLTCPSAVARIGALEDAGGVGRFEALVAGDSSAGESYSWGAHRQRELRRPAAAMADGGASLELGIGGTASEGTIKCLHAHAAFGLAQPAYTLGARIADAAAPLYPADRCCCS